MKPAVIQNTSNSVTVETMVWQFALFLIRTLFFINYTIIINIIIVLTIIFCGGEVW